MSDGHRSHLNQRLRGHITELIQEKGVGAKIRTDTVREKLQKKHRSWRIEIHQVANLMREREDLSWVETGVFMRVR